jgi:hypothetical protein
MSLRHYAVCGLLAALVASPPVFGDEKDKEAAANGGAVTLKEDELAPAAPKKFRKLAPGIENTIPPDSNTEEAFSRIDIIHLLERDPKFGERPWFKKPADRQGAPTSEQPPALGVLSKNAASEVRLQHNLWGLEFTFKPFGMMWLDVPSGDDKVERKLVWYMIYHVKNPGAEPVRFVPRVLLYSDDAKKWYADRINAVAVEAITNREDKNRKLLNSVDISENEIPPSPEGEDNSVWGVFTWEDIDPTTDVFSVYIQGLTNAYRREKVDDAEGKPQWQFVRKTLKINFWRPSDEFFETEDEIRLGLPKNVRLDIPEPDRVEYEWVYR